MDATELMKGIALNLSELTARWEVGYIDKHKHTATLKGPNGAELGFRGNGYDLEESSRLNISGVYPNYKGHCPLSFTFQYTDAKRPHITVAVDRGTSTIADDIRRRLLPDYLHWLEVAHERIEEYKANEEKIRTRTRRIAAAFGVDEESIRWNQGGGNVNSRPTFYTVIGDARISLEVLGDDVSLEILYAPDVLATGIGELIRAWADRPTR